MKVLVLSDSHSALSFMRRAVDAIRPDMILHLGDYYDDGEAIRDAYPYIRFCQVPGNCDRYRTPAGAQEILVLPVDGVKLYLTHGHRHGVKMNNAMLIASARAEGCQAALYGHTHEAYCHREKDGLWVLNPGSCGSYGGSVGLMEIENGTITSCRNLWADDLEANV